MSKAFVKESDHEAELPDELPAVPAGFKNYMTPHGHRHMQEELRQLLRVERPKVVETVAWAAGNGDRSENGDYIYGKRRLREIDRRIRFLTKRLESAEVVDPRQQKRRDQVFFGATVTYAPRTGPKIRLRSSASTKPISPAARSAGYPRLPARCSKRARAKRSNSAPPPGSSSSRSSKSATALPRARQRKPATTPRPLAVEGAARRV